MRKITNEELGRPTAEEFAVREKMPVTVVLDNVRSAQNVGAFFRTGDAFAVERIALCGITATPPSREASEYMPSQSRASSTYVLGRSVETYRPRNPDSRVW